MKRRNGMPDGKIARRPLKRNKISENFYGSSLVYVKLLLLWGLVLIADYFLEFRFEYLWPFWLFLRSVYDSFKYQGMAFSVFFVCIALTSDMICFLFIPVHWLFFAASTYVWVQYVWHTEKGICLPTVFLWLLFVYIEASIRLKEFKSHLDIKHLPFHLDLCRPFAAHCIGYPVVTLGFGFKSYVGYRMRQRRQRDVQKENEYYYEFCREALPPGSIREEAFKSHPSPKLCSEDRISDHSGGAVIQSASLPWNVGGDSSKKSPSLPTENGGKTSHENNLSRINHSDSVETENWISADGGDSNVSSGGKKSSKVSSAASSTRDSSRRNHRDTSKVPKDDQIARMEADLKRLKCDLQISRNKENELRDQIISYMSSERYLKSEISNLQVEKSVLESRVSTLMSTRAGEKATLSNLEKRLADERKQKTDFQIKLETERKTKKDADKAAQQNQARTEMAKLEVELNKMQQDVYASQERCSKAEQEIFVLRKYKDAHGDPEMLLNALKAMQEKNSSLENSLSAETKLKMDLFSALGEAKREMAIRQGAIMQKDREIRELKAKIAEVLAVMPTTSGSIMPNTCGMNGFAKSNTLAMELPHTTDLSFSRAGSKMMTLGLSSLEDQLSALDTSVVNHSGGLYTPASSLSSVVYSPQSNGNATDT